LHHAGEAAIFATLLKQKTMGKRYSVQISFGQKRVFASKTRPHGQDGILSTLGGLRAPDNLMMLDTRGC
jgi:hypothetical protein